ncbi:uncharacterized protein F5Z01DRAFT_634210 [Emericellopsis atlantica]|uniref:Uncharacterized protein n=1 Tax=Emericellopsis atlantica TaxID=2614577 RepID=A0A9P8CRD7_9HYPO|nr:uncharacterized protein F5Z01DRAFT_634210 [Emericellopsis atlantica]KAG9256633.1 hypothetical protein F5Z01DRAFT_634210 [Emericellopsis atlantica]
MDDRQSDHDPPRYSRQNSLHEQRMTRRNTATSYNSDGSSNESRINHNGPPATPPPRLMSSPSAGSSAGASYGVMSPLWRELSLSNSHDQHDGVSRSSSRLALARRLSHLAQQLTSDGEIDEHVLTSQLDQMEKAVAQSPPRSRFSSPHHRRPGSFESERGVVRSHSDLGGSMVSSPASSLYRSRFSDLSASLMMRESEPAPEPEVTQEVQKPGLTPRQLNKIIAEATKLNEELANVVGNLKARQEESNHIHDLLIERAERAAQRIMFLQDRISHLEGELRDNDDEIQHLRICLKAVEVQLPPNPDPDIQRCIASFKKEYQTLRKKRLNRSMEQGYHNGHGVGDVTPSPTR